MTKAVSIEECVRLLWGCRRPADAIKAAAATGVGTAPAAAAWQS